MYSVFVQKLTHSWALYVLHNSLSINQSILFLIKRYIIDALSAVQWNTHISLNIYIYGEIQHTYKHSYKAAISAQIQCFYFRHTHTHTRGRCERPRAFLILGNPSLVLKSPPGVPPSMFPALDLSVLTFCYGIYTYNSAVLLIYITCYLSVTKNLWIFLQKYKHKKRERGKLYSDYVARSCNISLETNLVSRLCYLISRNFHFYSNYILEMQENIVSTVRHYIMSEISLAGLEKLSYDNYCSWKAVFGTLTAFSCFMSFL